MNVELVEAKSGEILKGTITNNDLLKLDLPTLHDGWRFNFKKHSKKADFQTFVLTLTSSPTVTEGCLIFEMKKLLEPYMAYIEIAPHNKGANRKLQKVAGCLIAFACRLSFINGQGPYQGWLTFDVLEENPVDQQKLMTLYSKKYHAMRFENSSTMIIQPKDGENLIEQYLRKL